METEDVYCICMYPLDLAAHGTKQVKRRWEEGWLGFGLESNCYCTIQQKHSGYCASRLDYYLASEDITYYYY